MTRQRTWEAGQSAVEYGLVVGLVSLAVAVILAGAAPAWLGSIIAAADTALGAALSTG
ncbi:MAG: Flp family type IVb pilin [Chloroflexota bacterium]|nr:Flp family type IVb pilin [Dehalococcoidia bacterium]MDW8045853.1 Flp family type IVb pilin [Chloroflexota bacterium]